MKNYFLKEGDVYWAKLTGNGTNSSQRGTRPVLVIGNQKYIGSKTPVIHVIPFTTTLSKYDKKRFPTHLCFKLPGDRMSILLTEQMQIINKSQLCTKIDEFSDLEMSSVKSALKLQFNIA